MRLLNLPLKDNPYTIHIGTDLFEEESLFSSHCVGENVLIVTNDLVAPLYLKKLTKTLQDKNCFHLIIEDGEIHKSRESFFKIIDFLVENGFRRNDSLLALGGGVIGDLSGYAAASYQRGMNFIQVPTSLLAQVDSSVGGKTAINHQKGKNLIGAFYQPKAVFIDVKTLATLADREYLSGFGEIIKYALLGESDIERLLHTKMTELLARDEESLIELIYLCCQKKADIVAKDEKEKGERALLNLGHTFGHALETLTDYQYYLHGEAVAIGILMALNLSERKGFINVKLVESYLSLISQLNLPTQIIPKVDVNDFLSVMKKDKKNQTNAYRLVLKEDAKCILFDEDNEELLKDVIKSYMN